MDKKNTNFDKGMFDHFSIKKCSEKKKDATLNTFMCSAAWCVSEVLKVIGNRGHVLVKTKLCVGEDLCLHCGAPCMAPEGLTVTL